MALQGLTRQRLNELLERIREVRAVLIGDLCLDVYWSADMTRSVLSRETPHYPLPVTQERMSAGAGGNAAMNMAALAGKNLLVVGVVGDDWRGGCLMQVFADQGVESCHIVAAPGRITNAYCKPMRRGYLGIEVEDPRIDFEAFTPLSEQAEALLIHHLKEAVKDAQVLCVSDQFENGCITPKVRQTINQLAKEGLLVVVDSRMRVGEYHRCLLKPNEIECARALGWTDDRLSGQASAKEIEKAAEALSAAADSDLCLTLGARGCQIYRNGAHTFVKAVPTEPPVDTVGAGDCFLSAFSLALAAGATDAEAGVFGNLASSVCVKKIGTTGTASPEEILACFEREEAKEYGKS